MNIKLNESDGKIIIEITAAGEEKQPYQYIGASMREFCISPNGREVLVTTPDSPQVLDEKVFPNSLFELSDVDLFAALDDGFFNLSEKELADMMGGIRKLAVSNGV